MTQGCRRTRKLVDARLLGGAVFGPLQPHGHALVAGRLEGGLLKQLLRQRRQAAVRLWGAPTAGAAARQMVTALGSVSSSMCSFAMRVMCAAQRQHRGRRHPFADLLAG